MKTVILPVAGKGTRLLPLTKATPKELLPIFDKPILQFALDEARSCGADRLVVVTHESKPAIIEYLAEDQAEVESLRRKNKNDLAEVLNQSGAPEGMEVVFVTQSEALGLGHAILTAQPKCLPGPIGIILPDDVILGEPCLSEMASAYCGGHMVAAMNVDPETVGSYGIFDVSGMQGQSVKASGMVEKPHPDRAPSTLAAVGRYILDEDIFDALNSIPRGAGGEYQLTDAIAANLDKIELTAFKFTGIRFDCGSRDGLLTAGLYRQQELSAATTVLQMAAE